MSDSSVRRAVLQRLESLSRAGVRQLPPGEALMLRTAEPAEHAPVDPPAGPQTAGHAVPESADLVPAAVPDSAPAGRVPVAPSTTPTASTAPTLDVLQQEVAACVQCPELVKNRTQTVFGSGNPTARLCFLGEAPGAEEDQAGEPFIGPAGQLLTKIIAACGLNRSDAYILNVLKCRPPGNRNPAPEEAARCRGFLHRQLELIQPEFVCCLGAVAAQNLLQTSSPIGRLRGRVHPHGDFQVVCTYHPAYLLRNPAAKRDTWEDMKLLMGAMGIDLPSRS